MILLVAVSRKPPLAGSICGYRPTGWRPILADQRSEVWGSCQLPGQTSRPPCASGQAQAFGCRIGILGGHALDGGRRSDFGVREIGRFAAFVDDLRHLAGSLQWGGLLQGLRYVSTPAKLNRGLVKHLVLLAIVGVTPPNVGGFFVLRMTCSTS